MLKSYFLLVIFFFCIAYIKAQEVSPLFKCSKVLDMPYGVCAHFTRNGVRHDYSSMAEQLPIIHSMGIENVKCDIDYNTINTLNTGKLDSVLYYTTNNGLDLLGIAYDTEFYKKEWKNNLKFCRYLKVFGDHYTDKFKYLEFCNEIDFVKQIEKSNNYLSDLRLFYNFKKVDKNIQILFSGIPNAESPFLDSIMSKGAYNYFDIMKFHVYPLDEEQLVNKLNAIKVNLLKYNWSKTVRITEVGMHTEQVKTINTNEIFFKKVVPQALKTLGAKLNGLNYGFIQDEDNKYITLNVDEVIEYMLDKGACPYPVTFAQLKSLKAKEVPVLVATHDESFPSGYFPYILDFVRRGGTVNLPYGVPFYYNRTSSGLKSVGEIYAKQLHIGEWQVLMKKHIVKILYFILTLYYAVA